jgi:hypothetical protein
MKLKSRLKLPRLLTWNEHLRMVAVKTSGPYLLPNHKEADDFLLDVGMLVINDDFLCVGIDDYMMHILYDGKLSFMVFNPRYYQTLVDPTQTPPLYEPGPIPLNISDIPTALKSAYILRSLLMVDEPHHNRIQDAAKIACEQGLSDYTYVTQYEGGMTIWRNGRGDTHTIATWPPYEDRPEVHPVATQQEGE